MTATPTKISFWDLEGACIRQVWSPPRTYPNWYMIGYDVAEEQNKLVVALRSSDAPKGGNLILLHDLQSGQTKEVRKDLQEEEFSSFVCLTNSLTGVAVECTQSHTHKVRIFDLNNGREIGKWDMPGWSRHVRADPTNPNIFYVSNWANKIIMYDRNTKEEVRSFTGITRENDLQVPIEPGNLVVANDDKSIKMWDIGSARLMHEIPIKGGNQFPSLLGNVLAHLDDSKIRIFDLNEGVVDPARELMQTKSMCQREIYVTPHRIVLLANHLWVTNPYSCSGGRFQY